MSFDPDDRRGCLPEPGERELRELARPRTPGSDVSDAMRLAWLKRARDDDWHAEMARRREAQSAEEKAAARAANTYRAGSARRRP